MMPIWLSSAVSTTPYLCITSASWQFCMVCMDGVALESGVSGFGTIPHRQASGFEKNPERTVSAEEHILRKRSLG
jgi:hypothetical protein